MEREQVMLRHASGGRGAEGQFNTTTQPETMCHKSQL